MSILKMKSIGVLLFVFCMVWAVTANAQESGKIEAVEDKGLPYSYLVYYPEGYDAKSDKKYPIVMYLHGRSIRGNDLEKVKRYGVIYEILRGLKIDFIVIAPQCQTGWENDKLIEVLDYAEANYKVDRERVYLTGMSMGGYGAWYLAGAHPDRFAAVAPVAGGGKISDVESLKNLPHWVFHGKLDKAVPVTESQKMVTALRTAGNKRVKFTAPADWDHSDGIHAFKRDDLYTWFLEYKRKVNTKPVVQEPEVIAVIEETPKEPVTLKPVLYEPIENNSTIEKPEEVAIPELGETKKKEKKWWQFWKKK